MSFSDSHTIKSLDFITKSRLFEYKKITEIKIAKIKVIIFFSEIEGLSLNS